MATLNQRDLIPIIGGTDYSDQVLNCRLVDAAADSGDPTFAEARAGGARKYTLAMTIIQNPSTGSLWDLMWSSTGTTSTLVLKPAGGTTASATKPTFSGNVVITEPDGDILGGAASADTLGRWTTDVEWDCVVRPIRAFT